jgi:hypothetical protein
MDLRDYMQFLDRGFASSKTALDLVSRIPGTPEEKHAEKEALLGRGLEKMVMPRFERIGTQFKFDLKPRLVLDFKNLNKHVVLVNGVSINLMKNQTLLNDFRKVYQPKISVLDLMIIPVFAQSESSTGVYALDSINEAVIKPVRAATNNAIASVSNAAETAFMYGAVSYGRCEEGIDDCWFMSHAKTIKERLSTSEYRGLKEFSCENGKLKKIEAARSIDGSAVPSYEFFYNSNSENVRIKVANFGWPRSLEPADCEFSYNDRTKAIKPVTSDPRCGLSTPINLNMIGYDTPVGPAFRCCSNASCVKQVQAFAQTPESSTKDNKNSTKTVR